MYSANANEAVVGFSTAVSLAEYDARDQKTVVITLDHMKRVVMLSRQFKNYMTALNDGRDDDYMAKARGLRNDSYKDHPTIALNPQRHGNGGFQSYSPRGEQPPSGGRQRAARKDSGVGERSVKGRAKARGSDKEEEEEEEEEDDDD
jgi:hypothetical protein